MLKSKCAVCGNELIEENTNTYEELYGEVNGWLVVDLHCSVCEADVRYIIKTTQVGFTMCCDMCDHRTNDCLCDLSENDENCPLISEKAVDR